jgi:hypothetical protein
MRTGSESIARDEQVNIFCENLQKGIDTHPTA